MPLSAISVAKADFDRSGWETIIAQSELRLCSSYYPLFGAAANEATARGDMPVQNVFILLNSIASLRLRADSRDEPFAPLFVQQASRSAAIEDFGEDHLHFFAQIGPEVADAELRARIADVVWVRTHDFRNAQLAIMAYVGAAQNLEHNDGWHWVSERYQRALALARSIGTRQGYVERVVGSLEDSITKSDESGQAFVATDLMELLLESRKGDPGKYIAISERLAAQAETEPYWEIARHAWKLKARWHAIANESENERAALIRAAETYVLQAETARVRPGQGYLVAAHHLQSAIEAYRRIDGTKARREELHRLLLDYERESLTEIKTISHPIDLSNIAGHAEQAVKGKSLRDAVFTLVRLCSPPSVGRLRQQVQENAEKFPFQHVISTVAAGPGGKIVARKPSMLIGTPEEVEAATRAEMFAQAARLQQINAAGIIDPARRQIDLEHNIHVADFLGLVSDNPFVPPGRELIYARGLHAGITGDFLMATHLLIPQVDNSLRYILDQHGVRTSNLSADGIQEEFDLGTTLGLPELIPLLGEDLVFDLKGLLIERFGTNLRNSTAHGLLDHDAFYSVQAIYFWWLALGLCCLPLSINLRPTQEQTNPSKPEA